MLKLKDGVNIDLSIGGVDLPSNDSFSFNYLQIISDIRLFVPMMVIRFSDQDSLLRRYGIELLDAIPLTLSVGASPQTVKQYNFRLFRPKQETIQNLTTYTLYALLDAPKYLAESQTTIYQNQSSSQVVQQIAQNCGLQIQSIDTADVQTWRQGNKRNCEMVRYCAAHGYLSDDALLSVGVRMDGTMYYLDVNQIQPSSVYLTYSGQQRSDGSTIQIVDHKFDDQMGRSNIVRGWNSTLVEQLVTQDNQSLVNNTQIKPNADSVALNQALGQQMLQGRVDHTPIITQGAVHDNWSKARHQNTRGNLVQNMSGQVFTPQQTAVDLFDPVNIDSSFAPKTYDPAQGGQNGREGQYIVAGKSIVINSLNYGEKIRLVRAGVNSNQQSQG